MLTAQVYEPARFLSHFGENNGALPFTEGLAAVKVAKSWGFIDTSGSYVINPAFDSTLPFSEGFAGVKSGNRWGFINHKGDVIIQLQFDHVDSFADGLAQVKLGERGQLCQ